MAIRHWEDVVFENRNKDYGAYLLRRKYATRVLSGLGVTICFVTAMISLPRLFPSEIRLSEQVPFVVCDISVLPPPMVESVKPPKAPASPPKRDALSERILVTREPVRENEPATVSDASPDRGVVSGDVGTIGDIGTIPLTEPMPVVEPAVRDVAEVMPYYDGGTEAMMKFIQKKIRYPHAPRKIGIDGTVFVRFVVKGDGTVTDVEVIRGVHPDYDKEAMRVISLLPSWTGGRHNGMPVSVRMVIPIKFNLKQ